MRSFTQSGKKTLVEVVDKEAQSWKLLSVDASSVTTYFIVNAKNKIDLIATTFKDNGGTQHAVVLVDSSEKEESLAVLDRKFLMGVGNSTEAYRKWTEEKADFTFGSVQETRTIDFKKGGLGTGNIRVDGGTIVAQMNSVNCHCYELAGACAGLPSPVIACVNKICDLVNCVIAISNGTRSECNQEGSDAQQTCSIAVGMPQ